SRRIFIFAMLMCLIFLVIVAMEPAISAEDNRDDDRPLPHLFGDHPEMIAQFEGKKVKVEGIIVDTHIAKSGKVRFLNFSRDWRKAFTVVIFTTNLEEFTDKVGEPARYYLGKRVIVTGKVKIYKGRPEIIVKSPEQIKVMY
ncbi:MAG: hypothetical protein J7M18_08220, partial [Candidatus Eremiobacteraeota bacterium]|nr:hypothetical protein [Candidatus Eremiobacteraeota bacterium]